ncbi:MAG: acetyl-CoA carboxylase biotin carboxylase subunit [Candidatus Obscuribacterales bacterium]|nr:acetyl-CoA carboxylase biotin carboxylase subunit [Candidatus Obscuribacterales bacterium]
MFSKVLIANRGEIAVRVITACRELGIQTVAIFSDADKESRHVTLADESWRLDGQPGKVYLDSAQIIDIAKKSGAQAVHPGYGFLSENGDFAEACANASIKFIGPRPDIIRSMGSKVEARRTMDRAGVPVVPGTTDPVTTPEKVKELAAKYGYPVAIKASAGGGGRGLKVVRSESDVESALSSAQREGLSYFGSDEVYVEKYLDNPHHIEVQVLGDEHGYVVHLGERDCSSQRRHQKLVEETPAPILKDSVRQHLLQSAVKGATALGYTSAGTLEFLVSGDDYYFLEVNTRVQVEHPITEMVTGIDIVKEQIRVATGEKLSFKQEDVVSRGHSIEFRINAEDPFKNFMPSPGTVTTYLEPRLPWLRIDSACYHGYQILPFYDSLLAKLVVWGRDRSECIARALVALRDYKIEGVSTTIPFHIALMQDATFHAGEVDTKYVEAIFMKRFPQEFGKKAEPKAVAASSESRVLDNALGKNLENSPVRNFSVEVNQKQFKVSVSEVVDLDNAAVVQPKLVASGAKSNGGGANRAIGERSAKTTARSSAQTASTASSHGAQPGSIVAGMHGLVKEIFVKDGDTVKKGGKLLILEAMKMESEVIADQDGKVSSLSVKVGDTVEAGTQFLILS